MNPIRISPQILTQPDFRQLVMLAAEDPPVVLGRLAALGIAMAYNQRAKFTDAEINAIAAWKLGTSFAQMLASVGFARRAPTFYTLTLPVQGTNPRQAGGKERAAGAPRSPDGKFVGSGCKTKNTKLAVDAEGNVFKGKI